MIRSLGNRLCKNQLLEVDGQRRADKLRREDANKTEPAHSPGNAKYENKNTETRRQRNNIFNVFLGGRAGRSIIHFKYKGTDRLKSKDIKRYCMQTVNTRRLEWLY